jgi:hypothetical protein
MRSLASQRMSLQSCSECGGGVLDVKVERQSVTVDAEAFPALKLDQKVRPAKTVAGVTLKGGAAASFLTGKVVPVYLPHTAERCRWLQRERTKEQAAKSGIQIPQGLVVPRD